MPPTRAGALQGLIGSRTGKAQQASFTFLAGGFLALYLPTYWELARTVWTTDEQGHGPIILAVSAWLFWRRRRAILDHPSTSSSTGAVLMIAVALLLYIVGRSQSILLFEVGSQIPLISGLLWLYRGKGAVKTAAFALFFLCFMVPLPEAFVAAVTGPLKIAVSAVATQMLALVGYEVGRSGVILAIGPYQLLVADACAGLNTMFTLEALGLLYLNVMNHQGRARNVLLAIGVVPISFIANVIRVCILVLVTYHFGDAAGQGFSHSFAGIVLFAVALVLVIGLDGLLGRLLVADGKVA